MAAQPPIVPQAHAKAKSQIAPMAQKTVPRMSLGGL
jgi:hypothetical protein